MNHWRTFSHRRLLSACLINIIVLIKLLRYLSDSDLFVDNSQLVSCGGWLDKRPITSVGADRKLHNDRAAGGPQWLDGCRTDWSAWLSAWLSAQLSAQQSAPTEQQTLCSNCNPQRWLSPTDNQRYSTAGPRKSSLCELSSVCGCW